MSPYNIILAVITVAWLSINIWALSNLILYTNWRELEKERAQRKLEEKAEKMKKKIKKEQLKNDTRH